MYAIVNNNTVQNIINALPKAFTFTDGKTTGNFDLLDSTIQINEGVYPLEENKPVFDKEYQFLELADFDILISKVVRNWQVATRDIAVLKSEKIAAVNVLREQKIASGFSFNGNLFDSDDASLRNITAMATSVALGEAVPVGFSWRAANNSDIVMNAMDIRNFSVAARDHVYQLHIIARQHKAAVNARTTESEVAAYDINSGW